MRIQLGLAVLTLLSACTVTHRTRTIGKGNAAAEVDLGGPISTALGAPVPMPLFFVGGRYGVHERVDLSAAYNVTMLATTGTPLHLETGAHWAPIAPPTGWTLITSGELLWMSDFRTGLMVVPTVAVTGAHRWRKVAPYAGFTLALNAYRPFEDRSWLSLAPHLGAELTPGEHLGLTFELALLEATTNLYGSGMNWVFIAKGDGKRFAVLTPMIGLSWDFSGREQ